MATPPENTIESQAGASQPRAAMATATKHWLHKTPTELLDAGGRGNDLPFGVLRVHLIIKYQQSVLAIQLSNGSYRVPRWEISRGRINSSEPLSELVLRMLRPTTPAAAGALICPQMMEFGFAQPLAASVGTRLDIAVIIAPRFIDPQWTLQGFGGQGWWPLTGDTVAQLFAGRVLHRILGMRGQRVTTMQTDKYAVRLEILRSIAGCIRHAELSGAPNLESIAILEPTATDKLLHPQIGLFLMTVSAPWMNEIRAGMHAMDVNHYEGPSLGRSGHRTFRVIGWIDRRRYVEEVKLADTALLLNGAFRPDGSVAQNWNPPRTDGMEFFLETSDPQPVMDSWVPKLVMGTSKDVSEGYGLS